MDRKTFIRTCGFACLGGSAVSILLASCGSTAYVASSTANGNILTVKKTEFTASVNNKSIERKFVLLKTDKLSFPIYLGKLDDGSYSALLMQCTHQGCEL